VLLAVAVGAVVAMQIAGRLVDRFGAAAVTRMAGLALPVSLAGPAFSQNVAALVVSLILLGGFSGLMDVGMNAGAVTVERRYGRPIMSAFHAVYSLGGACGAGLGSLLFVFSWPITVVLPVCGALLVVLSVVCGRSLPSVVDTTTAAPAGGRLPVLVTLLGLLAFACLVIEGAAADWSGIHLHEVLGVNVGVAALGYVGFSTSMIAGRLVGDRVAQRFGPRLIVRWGGVAALIGLLLAVSGLGPVAAVAGWIVTGAGVSCVVPQLFTAAGKADQAASGAGLARVVTLGYFGFLAGPPLIGWLAHASSLSTALLLPALLAALVALSAGIIEKSS
jgi:MFS family permease